MRWVKPDPTVLLALIHPGLQNPDFAKLRRMVLARYGKALDLGAVG